MDGALRMQHLIQDLLAFSRVGTRGKQPVPVDASLALEEAMQNLKMRIEETKCPRDAFYRLDAFYRTPLLGRFPAKA